MTVASRMMDLGTETAFEVLAKAKALEAQGREIIHLEIGEPDFDTPNHIVEAGVQALREGYTHYGPTPGLPELRDPPAILGTCPGLRSGPVSTGKRGLAKCLISAHIPRR